MNLKNKTILSVLLTYLLSLTTASAQKDYEPTTSWPYLLDDFYQGTLVLSTDTVSKAKLNIHLRAETLDCIDTQGRIARVVPSGIKSFIINNKVYRFVDGKPMLQIHTEDDAMLMDYKFLDFDLIDQGYNQGKATYARQENATTSLLANRQGYFDYKNIHMAGEFNEDYKELRSKMSDGQALNVKHTPYFVIKDKAFPATKSDCNDQLDKAGKKQFKTFLKTKKFKWDSTEDLIAILQYLKTLIK